MTARAWARLAGWLLVLTVAGCTVNGHDTKPSEPAHTTTGTTTSPSAPETVAAGNQDPARFAPQVRAHAAQADVNPVLVMAILYNESYKPHDPDLERAWEKIDPNAAFGIANMHRAAFDDTKKGRPFAGRSWEELPDDPDLAIQAASWYLHDLDTRLPKSWPGPYSRDDLLALGYNAGPGNMTAFARGTAPSGPAQSYLDTLRGNWSRAEAAVGNG